MNTLLPYPPPEAVDIAEQIEAACTQALLAYEMSDHEAAVALFARAHLKRLELLRLMETILARAMQ